MFHFSGWFYALMRRISRSCVSDSRIIISLIGLKFKNLPYDPQTGFKIFMMNKDLRKVFEEEFKTRKLQNQF